MPANSPRKTSSQRMVDETEDEMAVMARHARLIDGLPSNIKPVRFDPPAIVACLDTETTGFDPQNGERLISIGVVILDGSEIVDKREWFCNPQCQVPAEAQRVHGISTEFLADKPLFGEIAEEFLAFIGDVPLVIHNSNFDIDFLQTELLRSGRHLLGNPVIDTLELGRVSQEPGKSANLDSLMKHLGVTWINREHHGALKDAEALAYVYLAYRAAALQMKPKFPVLPDPSLPLREPRYRLYGVQGYPGHVSETSPGM